MNSRIFLRPVFAVVAALAGPAATAQDFMSMGDAVFSSASAMQMNSAIHCQTNDCPDTDVIAAGGDFSRNLPRPSVEQVRALNVVNRRPEVTRAVEQELQRRIAADNPEAARAFVEVVRSHDMIAAFDELVAPYRLRSNRLNDALTAYWVMAWTVIHGVEIPPPPPVIAVNDQVRRLLAHNDVVFNATPDQRQEAADGLIYQFMFLHAAYTGAQRAGDRAALQRLAEATRRNLASGGVDLAEFELTADIGFKPRS
jgi:hypothetical protein